jgi:hypothetical protein
MIGMPGIDARVIGKVRGALSFATVPQMNAAKIAKLGASLVAAFDGERHFF